MAIAKEWSGKRAVMKFKQIPILLVTRREHLTVYKRFFGFLMLLAVLAFPNAAQAGATVDGDPMGGFTTSSTVNDAAYSSEYTVAIGSLYGSTASCQVQGFALPYLAPGQTVSSASISFHLISKDGTPPYNLQLYGLKRVSTVAYTLPLLSDWYVGANDTANTLLAPQFITPSTAATQTVSYSGANLTTFIQNAYANTAFSGMDLTATRCVFFRLSQDASHSGFDNYVMGTPRNPNRVYHPLLTLNVANGISNVAGRLQFSFSLPQASDTSAGVYNTTTGALIRTLWGNAQYPAGTDYGFWDGKDDSGALVAAGTSYQIKLIYHNVQYVFEGMVGNTSASQSGAQVYHGYEKMQDMSISGTKAYYTLGYNELQNPFHTFTVGAPQVPSELIPGFTDCMSNFDFMTADSAHVYYAKGTGGINAADTYIFAFNTSNNALYTFPKGQAPTGSYQSYLYTSCIDFDATANQPNPATGLAVQKTGNDLFVSHASLNLVRVFDKLQGTLLGSFPVTNPGRMATTANGDVWIISGTTTPTVSRYTFANGTATLKQTLSGTVFPVGVGVSADDSLVLVADGGASQQIKAYNNSTGVAAWTYGVAGGIAVNGPNIGSNTFEFRMQMPNSAQYLNESFIAFQADNTFWIGDEGNDRAVHFSINGTTLTYLEQISYKDATYRSAVDVSDPTRVFSEFYEYTVNYALPLGGTNGSWTLARNWGFNLPSDSTHNYVGEVDGFYNVATLSNGRTYAFLINQATNTSDLFELPPTGPIRNTGYAFPSDLNNPYIYADGTLRYFTQHGSTLTYYSQPLTGFDVNNNPSWGSPVTLASTVLASTDPIPWAAFPTHTEVTASGGVVVFGANEANTGFHLGALSTKGTGWQWHASPSINGVPWFPQDGKFDCGNGVEYAGNIAMALGRNIVYGYHGELWGGGEASQWVNFLDNGLMVGRFGTYATANLLGSGTMDGFAGNSFSPTLVRAANGKVYLYHNDESNHGGTCRWRIDGWDAITELDGTGSVGGTVSLSPNTAGPVVSITSPTTGAAYFNGGNLTLSAQAQSSGVAVTSVKFLDGTTTLGTVTQAPFAMNATGLASGTHVITALATDANGLSTTSAAVTITVGADGTSAPPSAPVSLVSTGTTASSVALSWSAGSSTTSSTIGQIISFQCAPVGSTTQDLAPTTVTGVAPYAAANFNMLGQTVTDPADGGATVMTNVVSSTGVTINNIGLFLSIGPSYGGNWVSSIPASIQKIFNAEIQTPTPVGATISNIPFANYDVVVYSFNTGSCSVTVGDYLTNSSTVKQTFTKVPTGYVTTTVPFSANSTTSVTDVNTIIFQGLTSPLLKLQGGNIAAIQIVERPVDRGTVASYSIERALGTSGTFAAIGTSTGSVLSYTDSTASASTTYQYRVRAINSFGSSSYTNVVAVTTPANSSTASVPPSAPSIPSTPSTGIYSSWQSKYFTAAQLADASISGPSADPYGSRVPNLLAYALQLDPSSAQLSDIPTATPVSGHLTMTYLIPTAVTDINYIPEVSTDLQTWNSGFTVVQVVSSVTGANGVTITVQDILPTTTAKHFMRLRVTQH
jgi:Bacterial Ig domain